MANPTSNFGWQMPTPTDLVTDLPADFEVFGQAVDTSLADLKGGTSGQVLSKNSNTDMDFVWVTSDDANAIQNSIVDAKGDLIAASANDTPARLAVGANGETLVADSSTSTGLRYQGSQAAGKNYQINGGFDNWQRSTSSATLNAYATADRWYQAGSGTVTYSRDTDVPANQGFTYSAKWLTGASSSFGEWYSALEAQDVNVLAGRAVTLSYWIKSSGAYSGTATLELQLGTTANTLLGGTWSSSAVSSTVTPTGTWTKYQATGTITAGTVGLRVRQVLSTAQASGIGLFITGVQIELGSVATTFTRSGGTLQGELAACQRYCYVIDPQATSKPLFNVTAFSAGQWEGILPLPVEMRTAPTSTVSSGTNYFTTRRVGSLMSTLSGFSATKTAVAYFGSTSGLTGGQSDLLTTNNTAAKITVEAEL